MAEIQSCVRRVRPHLSDHLDGQRVPLIDRLAIALHLRVCPACQRTHRSLTTTLDALRALRDVDPAAGEPGDDSP
jgi:predicted anti-sigma-YlaC factor YlaD